MVGSMSISKMEQIMVIIPVCKKKNNLAEKTTNSAHQIYGENLDRKNYGKRKEVHYIKKDTKGRDFFLGRTGEVNKIKYLLLGGNKIHIYKENAK